MKHKIDYLLKYVSSDMFDKILNTKNNYILELLENNYIDVDLNIKYLIKYGITNTDQLIYNILEDLIMPHNDFIKKIENYEKTLTKEEVIMLIENI